MAAWGAPDDETAAMPTRLADPVELAWSAEEFRPYYYQPIDYRPTGPAPRTRVEVATAIWTLLAIAIMYGCTSDSSYPRVVPAESVAAPATTSYDCT